MKNSALNYALWLLGRRDRTIGEVKEKLLKKEYPQKEITETIEFLVEKKFLDDERFAKNYIRNQLSIKPLGKYQLKIKLKKKLVPEEIIESATSEIDESVERRLAEEAAQKWKIRKYKVLSIRYQGDKNKIRNALLGYLTGRGFNYENIKEIIYSIIA